jgi:hypothetical protein
MGFPEMIFAPKKKEAEPQEPEGPEVGDSLDLLQSIYRDVATPMPTRMRAAALAIAYERPKLAVTGRVDMRGFGDALDAVIAKGRPKAEQSAMVAQRQQAAANGERPVVSDATFRRVAERVMAAGAGNEAVLDPVSPRRKPG